MEQEETSFIVYDGVVVPESVIVKREKVNRYGSVPGLEDDELADPDEIERQVYREELAPVLQVPVKGIRHGQIGGVTEDGSVDFGAFGTVDFERTMPAFDKVRYKAEKLREELGNLILLMELSKSHVPGSEKYMVLKYLDMGVIDIDHIESVDMLILARQYVRARRIQKEIRELEEASWRRQGRRYEAWLTSSG